jgi:hypothetical protein
VGREFSTNEDKRNAYRWKSQNERDKLEDKSVIGRIIFKWIMKREMDWYGLDSAGSGLN